MVNSGLFKEEAMRMRCRKGRWYTNMRHPNNPEKKLEISLGAYEHETRKAQINLGKLLADMEKGIDPVSARQQFGKIKLAGQVDHRTKRILQMHLYPFFGEYKPREITKEVIERYYGHRWGLCDKGGLQATSTMDKEMRVFIRVMQVVDKRYELPKIRHATIKRVILEPLTYKQIQSAVSLLDEKYHAVFWIMAYTGMDVSDAVNLKPEHIKDGWIDKPRGKVQNCTGERIVLPIIDDLKQVLQGVPRPINKGEILFPNIKPKAVTTAVIRAFRAAGLEGYGAKYLRRYVASMLLDAGFSHDWIGKALAHNRGSKITEKYTKVYREAMGKAFDKIGRVG